MNPNRHERDRSELMRLVESANASRAEMVHELEAMRDVLKRIVSMKTPHANATVMRIVRVAKDALKEG